MPSVRNTLLHVSLLGLTACVGVDGDDAIDTDEAALIGPVPGDDSTEPPRSPLPTIVDPFAFGGFWILDWTDGSMAQAWKDGTVWRWPVEHDLRPRYVHLIWKPQTLEASAQSAAIADPDGSYTVGIWINGVKLTRGDDATTGDYWTSSGTLACPLGKTCLFTSIHAAKFLSFGAPRSITLVYQSKRSGSSPITVTGKAANALETYSFFQNDLIPTFRHPNCTTCHKLGDQASVIAQHGPYGGPVQSVIYSHAGPSGTQLRCSSGCHVVSDVVYGETFNETEWMTPGFDQGINFSAVTDAQICAKVKQRLPTDAAKLEHFLEDARIAWAVHDGELPLGVPGGSEAPPGSYWDFAAIVEAWVAGGSPCP